MGITIGDSLAVVATLVGVGLSLWALLVALSLLFEDRAKAAQAVVSSSPWKPLLLGAMLVLTLGVLFLALAGSVVPPVKLAGIIGLLWMLSQAAIGATGLARFAADRVRQMDPECSPYRAVVRGTGFLVIAGFLPFLGWFAFTPLVLCTALGSSVLAMFRRESVVVPPVILP